jgi:hypothetical protein
LLLLSGIFRTVADAALGLRSRGRKSGYAPDYKRGELVALLAVRYRNGWGRLREEGNREDYPIVTSSAPALLISRSTKHSLSASVLFARRREPDCRSGRRTKHPTCLQPVCRNAWLPRCDQGLHAPCPRFDTTMDRSHELFLRPPGLRGQVRSDSNGELPPANYEKETGCRSGPDG